MPEYVEPGFWGVVLLKLLVATLCGGVIGYEREMYDHPAGFRTHVLVCVGAAVYMLVSVAVAGDRFDPGRIAAQVASGIGFLGAGTIIKQGSIVRGLTTAASLWAVAGIGLAAGYSLTSLVIALLGTFVVLLTLYVLKTIEFRIEHRRVFALYATLADPRTQTEGIRKLLVEEGIEVTGIIFSDALLGPGELVFECVAPSRKTVEHLIDRLSANEAVRALRWEYR